VRKKIKSHIIGEKREGSGASIKKSVKDKVNVPKKDEPPSRAPREIQNPGYAKHGKLCGAQPGKKGLAKCLKEKPNGG